MVVGFVLTWKPNPVYYLDEKTGKVDKYKYNYLFILICVPGIILYFLLLLSINFQTCIIIYFSTLILLVLIGIICNYKKINFKPKKEIDNNLFSKVKRFISSNKSIFYGFMWGRFGKNLLVLGAIILLITVDFCYGIISRYKKEKFSKLFFYTFIWLIYITLILSLHIIFAEVLPEYMIYFIIVLVFIIQVMTFLNALDNKKHSPKYEKQYLEENSLQTDGSNTL
jgi:hypothetical protein